MAYRERPRPSSVTFPNNRNGSRPCSIPPPSYRPPGLPSNNNSTNGNGTSDILTSSSSADSIHKMKLKAVMQANGGNSNYPLSPSYVGAVHKQFLKFDLARPSGGQNGGKFPKESPSIDSLSSNLSSPLESSVGESGSPLGESVSGKPHHGRGPIIVAERCYGQLPKSSDALDTLQKIL